MKKIIKCLSLCSIVTLTILLILNPTKAKYVYYEAGNAGYHNFSKFEIFAEEFVIRDNEFDPVTGEAKSENLWGQGTPETSSDIGSFDSQYAVGNLQEVSFGVRNSTKSDIALSSFEYTILCKNNSDYSLTFSVINTKSTNAAYNIQCSIELNRTSINCTQLSTQYTSVVNGVYLADGTLVTSSGKFSTVVGINPLDYYKHVTVSGTFENPTLNINANDGTINPVEQRIIEEYYVLTPGEVFEYNLKVESSNAGNAAGLKHSFYSTIKMYAKKYNPETDIITANL